MKLTTQIKSLIVCFALTVPVFINAQEKTDDNAGKMRFGFAIAPTFNWTKSNSTGVEPNGLGIGFNYGLMMDFKLHKNYYFATGVSIIHNHNKIGIKGDTFELANGAGASQYKSLEYNYKTQYVQVPLTIKMMTNEIGYNKYWFQFGFAPAILINAKTELKSDPALATEFFDPNSEESDKVDFKTFQDNVNFYRLPLIVAAGMDYNISGNTSLHFGITFNNGFSDMLRDKRAKAASNFIGLNVGVFF